MRLMVDSVIAVMLIGILGGVLWNHRLEQQEIDHVLSVQESMSAIMAQSMLHAASGQAAASPAGYALTVNPEWFERAPGNMLLLSERVIAPWLEPVEHAQQNTFNPRRIVADERHAAFWYNPFRCLIRARVPMRLSQEETIELYNLVNGTALRVEDVDWPGAQKTIRTAAAGK